MILSNFLLELLATVKLTRNEHYFQHSDTWIDDVRKLIAASDAGIQFTTMVKGFNKEELKHLLGAFVELAKYGMLSTLS